MHNTILRSACFLIAASGAALAVATQAAPAAPRPTCDAKYYNYLVGKGLDEARSIEGSNYRVLPSDATRGEANPRRMTVVYDPRSNQITEVACG